MKQKIILIVSVVIGLIAALISSQYINAKERELAAEKKRMERQYYQVEVVVLKTPLVAGTVLKRDDLGVTNLPENSLREDTIRLERNIATTLTGRTLAVSVEAGAPLLWIDIEGGSPERRGISSQIKQKMRAISINVSGSASVSGMVRPTDRVDVIGTFSLPSKTAKGETDLVTMTVLQDVLILATGKETAHSSNQKASNYSMVTLEVSLQEAETLIFTESIRGRLSLALRNPEDMSYEKDLPQVNFEHIRGSLEQLNTTRQEKILRKRNTR